MAASPIFKLSSDGGGTYLSQGVAQADANALAYNAAGSYSIKAALISGQDVVSASWAFSGADDVTISALPAITTAADKLSCTFSCPKQGVALLLTVTVTDGGGSSTYSLAVKSKTVTGQQLLAIGETYEANTVSGWVKAINDGLRAAGGGSIAAGAAGQLFTTNAVPATAWQTMSGDGSFSSGAVLTVAKVNGATYPAAGALTTGNVPTVTGVGAVTYQAINLAGGSNYVTGVLPLANHGSPTGTGLAKVSGGAWVAAAATIVDADVNASAAIAVSKLAAGTAAQLLITNAGATAWAGVAMSGDATITAAGVISVASPGALVFCAQALNSLSAASWLPVGNNATSNATEVGEARMAKLCTITSGRVHFTGSASNVGGQTITVAIMVNGSSVGSVTLASTAGTQDGNIAISTTMGVGDRVSGKVSISSGLTATITNVILTVQ